MQNLSVFDAKLTSNSNLHDFFASSIVVIQSQFFRRPEVFQELEQAVLPDLVQSESKGILRCWSAGCSDGREAYSLAFLIQRFLEERHLSGKYDFRIDASDINPNQIEIARRGIFEVTDQELCRLAKYGAYFQEIEAQTIVIEKSLMAKVRFQHENIYLHQAIDKYHLIFCHNVLIYYDLAMRFELIKRMINHLSSQGVLYIDAVGRSSMQRIGLLKKVARGFAYTLQTNQEYEVYGNAI